MKYKVHEAVKVSYAELTNHKDNPRKISKKELEKLAKNILTYGFVENVVVRKETGEIISGHQRVAAMKLLKDPKGPWARSRKAKRFSDEIPVVYIEGMSDKWARALMISMNKIQGTWDKGKLTSMLGEIYPSSEAFGDDVYSTGYDLDEYTKMVKPVSEDEHTTTEDLKRIPKLTLEFRDKSARDEIKKRLLDITEDSDMLSGDALLELLSQEDE